MFKINSEASKGSTLQSVVRMHQADGDDSLNLRLVFMLVTKDGEQICEYTVAPVNLEHRGINYMWFCVLRVITFKYFI